MKRIQKIFTGKSNHKDNGHLGGNRTVFKIIEKGFKWDNMLDDVMNYIKYECKECINQKNGERIKVKSKIIVTKGPKERFIIDGFQLDDFTKEITGYSYVIEIIYSLYKYN